MNWRRILTLCIVLGATTGLAGACSESGATGTGERTDAAAAPAPDAHVHDGHGGDHADGASDAAGNDPNVLHFHHVHFNTADPSADLAFFEDFFGAPAVELCSAAECGSVDRATRTERGYFLYTQVDNPPDPTLDTYLEHIGWINSDPTAELLRLTALSAPLWPEERNQCAEAVAGERACPVGMTTDFYFYLEAPSGARIEVALGPGPATSGFGHVHMIQGGDLSFFETITNRPFDQGAIDMVNHVDVALTEDMLGDAGTSETRGKPIDHLAYSTTALEMHRDRIRAAGITIEEDIALRPAHGFRSFFVKSEKGIWVEVLEAARFEPTAQ